MDEIKHKINKAVDFLEQDNRGVQLGCYSVALAGLSIAIRRVRPFSRFRKPSDIPNHFIKEKRELTGVVEGIDPNGALLMVRHRPLVPLPRISNGLLPVKISGIDVTGLGITWLQTVVVRREIKFIPLVKRQDYVHCQVLLTETNRKKKERLVNVGESLVKVGFGKILEVPKEFADDTLYLSYWNRLHVAEDQALRKEMGLKYYVKPTLTAFGILLTNLFRLIQDIYRQIILIPKLPAS